MINQGIDAGDDILIDDILIDDILIDAGDDILSSTLSLSLYIHFVYFFALINIYLLW